ncbi:flagellar hook-basal body complex protein FliE [Citricoccus parietis]
MPSLPSTPAVNPTSPTSAATAGAPVTDALAGVTGTTDTPGADFSSALAGQVDSLQALQGERDTLNLQAVTGDLEDIHQATIAAAEASATMDLMVALRNSGLQAFNELMRIQA